MATRAAVELSIRVISNIIGVSLAADEGKNRLRNSEPCRLEGEKESKIQTRSKTLDLRCLVDWR